MDQNGPYEIFQKESALQTNMMNISIKTMDSQVYPLRVHRLMSVLALKNSVAMATGVLIQHQRLLHKGRVLMDDQSLSSCNIDDGHTVHLVTHQPDPSSSGRLPNQPALAATVFSDGESSRSSQDADPDIGLTAFRIQGYENMQDISRAISTLFQGLGLNATVNGQAGQVLPDAMTTMFQSLSRMLQLYHVGAFPPVLQQVDPTPDALATLLMETRPLLSNAADHLRLLSRTLDGQSRVSNSTHRRAIQADVWRVGTQLQDIGAFFLELGRVTNTVRLNRSTPQAVVGSGPAMFITDAGPSPNLLQPRDPDQPGTSCGIPHSVSEDEDPNIGSSSRQGNDESNPPYSKRQRRD